MADPEVRPFAPLYFPTTQASPGPGAQQGSGVASATAVAGVAATASTLFPGQAQGGNTCRQILVANKTSVWVHINFGVFAAVRAATLTDMGVPPGGLRVFTVDPEVSGASVISDGAPAASTAVLFTRGVGA